jgi:hypothetical protein
MKGYRNEGAVYIYLILSPIPIIYFPSLEIKEENKIIK